MEQQANIKSEEIKVREEAKGNADKADIKERKEELRKGKNKTPNTRKAASFFQLQYSLMNKKNDWLIILGGTIGSLAMGVSMPLFAITFGGTINTLGSKLSNYNPEHFIENIRTLCLNFLYVGLGMWVASFVMIYLWIYNGRIISKRIKKEYFRLLMRQ